jgi:hypothetical protein
LKLSVILAEPTLERDEEKWKPVFRSPPALNSLNQSESVVIYVRFVIFSRMLAPTGRGLPSFLPSKHHQTPLEHAKFGHRKYYAISLGSMERDVPPTDKTKELLQPLVLP